MGKVAKIERSFYRILKTGASREDAAVESGFPLAALETWLERGSRGLEPYASFARNVCRIESSYKNGLISNVRKAAAGDESKGHKPNWGAAGWLLERRFGDEYARVDEEKVTEMMMKRINQLRDGVVNVLLRYVPDESKEAAADALEEVFLSE